MLKYFVRLSCVIAIAALLSGCSMLSGFIGEPSAEPPAAEMMPDLPGYKIVEGQTLTDYISKASGGAALMAGHPELTAMVAGVDAIISCYQEVGAVRARIYSNEANILSAGTVAIADKKALTDPVNLFRCVGMNVGPGKDLSAAVAIQPCTANYTLTRDGNEFYIVYAGTTLEICQAFCANLEGCTAH